MSRLPLAMHNTPATAPTKKPPYKGQWGTQTLRPATPSVAPYNGQRAPFPANPVVPSAGKPNPSLLGQLMSPPPKPAPAPMGPVPQNTALPSRLPSMPQEPQATTAPTGQRAVAGLLPALMGEQGSFQRTGGPPNAQKPQGGVGTWNGIRETNDLVYRPGQPAPLGSAGKPFRPEAIYLKDKDGNQVDLNGNILHRRGDPAVQLLSGQAPSQQVGQVETWPPADPKTPEEALQRINALKDTAGRIRNGIAPPDSPLPQTQSTLGQLSQEGERYLQSLDNPVMPSGLTPQGQEAWGARQREMRGQANQTSVGNMLSGNGTRAMGENGMPIRNTSGAPLPNTVQGSVGGDGSPVYRPDGSRMVEPVGGWNPNQVTEPTPLNPQAQMLRDAMQKRYDAAQATKQQNLMARLSGQAAPATGPRADSSNSRWMAAREERQGRRDAARELIAQRGMAQAANRTARIEARKSANMPMNPMQVIAMRNPAFALGMQRMALDAQQANLDRDIQREELAIRKDALKGDVDERRETRLQAMKMQQADNELKKQQLDQSGELGRGGLAQDQAQHDERMQELRNQNSRYDSELQRDTNEKRAATRIQLKHDNPYWSENDLNAELDRLFPSQPTAGLAGSSAPAPGDGGQAGPPRENTLPNGKPYYVPGRDIPRDLKNVAASAVQSGDPTEFARAASAMGFEPEHIDSMWRKIVGNRTASIAEPEGPTLLGSIGNSLFNWWNDGGIPSGHPMSEFQRRKKNFGNRI